MKKLLAGVLILLVLALAGCDIIQSDDQSGEEVENQSGGAGEVDYQIDVQGTDVPTSAVKVEWPVEFGKWDVPIIKDAFVSLADNRSANQEGLTQGVTAIVNLKSLSREDFDSYLSALEGKGFTCGEGDSMADIMYLYTKAVTDGEISVTLVFDADVTTITVSNSAAAAEKIANAGGEVEWPSTLKDIPAFTKGKFKETVEMGGGMYAINYIGVSESDLDWYRQTLLDAGFQKQDSPDTEGYMRMDTNMAYSVGFTLEGDVLQVVAIGQSY